MRQVLLIIQHSRGRCVAGSQLGADRRSADDGHEVTRGPAGWYRVTGNLSGPLYIPAGVLLVVTGVWMVLSIDTYSFADPFVIIGLTVIVVGAILGNAVFGPPL